MTDLIRQQKKDAIEKLNKELNELKSEPEEPEEPGEPEEPTETEEAPPKLAASSLAGLQLEKPKRPRTEKQIKQFELVRQRKMAEAGKRKTKREEDERENKAQLEKQLIEKAIKLKKKQINRMKIVEDLSEDDEDDDDERKSNAFPASSFVGKSNSFSTTNDQPIKKPIKKAPLIKIAPVKAQVVDPYEAFKLKFKIN